MEKLSGGTTVVMRSPLEGDSTLVRTGLLENSLVEAALAGYSEEYKEMTSQEKLEFVSKLEQKIYKKVLKVHLPLELPLPTTQETFLKILEDTSSFCLNKNTNQKFSEPSKKLILALIQTEKDESTYEHLFNYISKEKSISRLFYMEKQYPLHEQVRRIIQRSKFTGIISHNTRILLEKALSVSMQETLHDYTRLYVKELSSRLERNILILSGESRKPSWEYMLSNMEYPKTLLVVKLKDEHNLYELVSRYHEKKEELESEFDTNDPLIQAFLTNKELKPKKSKKDLLVTQSDDEDCELESGKKAIKSNRNHTVLKAESFSNTEDTDQEDGDQTKLRLTRKSDGENESDNSTQFISLDKEMFRNQERHRKYQDQDLTRFPRHRYNRE